MNRHVSAIAGRLSLRPPQREALEILDRICEAAPPKKGADPAAALAAIQAAFPAVTDFEREFPSICFALATGVGKTRLMGAFIAYLHLAHGIRNFFVLAPNLTIYQKLIADFTPNTPKYVFQGIAEFSATRPEVITGDDYEARARTLFDELIRCKINIFNISKINAEVRGGKSPRIKRLSEYIGESYFDYLAGLPDLVVLMDESHRYRASAGVRAINELKPILGLELTATPLVESSKGAVRFQNVVLDYPLGRAIEDGLVKEPAVVTRKDFDPSGMSAEQIERLKLEDGIRLHEHTKVELETYARETAQSVVKPFVLVIARDTTHAAELVELVKRDDFFGGRYRDKVIQVDSSRTGAAEEEMIGRLLQVQIVRDGTIDVPRVLVVPRGEVRSGYRPFSLDLSSLRLQAPSEELWIQYLRTGQGLAVGLGGGGIEEKRLVDYVVRGLVDFDDVAYDAHAGLLYGLAEQTVAHLRSYLSEDETRRVLQFHEREIARFIHTQMQAHHFEDAEGGYEIRVSRGFVPIKASTYTAPEGEAMLDFRTPPPARASIGRHVFSGFQRCLCGTAKFQSDTERIMAIILDRESLRWLRPARGQFQITYRVGPGEGEYQPDFVAETDDAIYMIETKRRGDLESPEVLAKKAAALEWCEHASAHAAAYGGKPWVYALIPHDVVAENMTIEGLVRTAV